MMNKATRPAKQLLLFSLTLVFVLVFWLMVFVTSSWQPGPTMAPPKPFIKTTPGTNFTLGREGIRSLMAERQMVIEQTCKKVKTLKTAKDPSFLRWDNEGAASQWLMMVPKRKFMWCLVGKAASTAWNTHIVKLAGHDLKDNETPWKVAMKVTVAANLTLLKQQLDSPNHKSLLIVRNPFDRLVSAYRDKLEHSHPKGSDDSPFDNLSRNMARTYRQKAIGVLGKDYFEAPNFGAELPVQSPNERTNSSLASFWEFVQHLIHTDPRAYNIHWKPISIHCQLCSSLVKYNYIMKLESRRFEEPLLIEEMGFAKELSVNSKESGKRPNSNAFKKMSQADVTLAYFKRISVKDRKALYDIFKYDFELFDYKPHPEILADFLADTA